MLAPLYVSSAFGSWRRQPSAENVFEIRCAEDVSKEDLLGRKCIFSYMVITWSRLGKETFLEQQQQFLFVLLDCRLQWTRPNELLPGQVVHKKRERLTRRRRSIVVEHHDMLLMNIYAGGGSMDEEVALSVECMFRVNLM